MQSSRPNRGQRSLPINISLCSPEVHRHNTRTRFAQQPLALRLSVLERPIPNILAVKFGPCRIMSKADRSSPLQPGKSKRSQNIWPIICNESRRRISAPVPPAQVRVEIQLVALLGSRCHLCGRDGSHRPIRYRRNATPHDHSALARVSNPFVVVFTGVLLIALTVSEWPDTRRGDRIKRPVLAKTNAAIEKHFMTLAEKWTQLARENGRR
jgi:hypothetical protein